MCFCSGSSNLSLKNDLIILSFGITSSGSRGWYWQICNIFSISCLLKQYSCFDVLFKLFRISKYFIISSFFQVNITDTFGKVMISNLHQRGILLPGLGPCESLEAQKKRLVVNSIAREVFRTKTANFFSSLVFPGDFVTIFYCFYIFQIF